MKLMTLNAHAWHEENQLEKIAQLAAFIGERDFDVVAMQEINQPIDGAPAPEAALERYFEAEQGLTIREGHYMLALLEQLDTPYYWTWIPTHATFKIYDEGLAVLSKRPITEAFCDYVSALREYENHKTRRILAVKTSAGAQTSGGSGERIEDSEGRPFWLVDGHYGWWHDEVEPFRGQWDRTEELLAPLRKSGEPLFLLGDLNNVAQIRGEGYDYILEHGWCDLYTAAAEKDEGSTVLKAIAGWSDNERPLRIDYILSSDPVAAKKSEVILDGKNGAVVSDHFGVAAEI
ncbi:endonuclease/exonuclease/phosphatase family protein [Saccharibacillus sp. CPCC 101409]|uniref:endonuclease/exonuclease/phosphatase family protein n=1 Tax=Saccharibacillus sp. CPCC 101409 TaxID=3058041 RepID=UPI0026735DAB|nr:endonuclease/exonuclease/phosphatase family protein [Saccharibacillus sp. CPCC 101409]MDO3411598.1 endonuclease/exonuclease/phosphatase family protein [Saccharibacillus sp. CPCC 101409]